MGRFDGRLTHPRRRRAPALSPRIRELIQRKKSLRLDIGCGEHKQPGPDVVGIDARPLDGVDIVHDLEEFPWPLPDSCVRVAFASHFLEHVKPWKFLPLMAELHRVMLHDGQVLIAGPLGVEFRFVQDPTHCFGPETEVLTDRGFRFFEEVQVGDRCAVLDSDQLTTSFSPVVATIAQPYIGHLLHFKTERMDLLVTPNHDLLSSSVNYGSGYRGRARKRAELALRRHRADELELLSGHHSRRGLATLPAWRGEQVSEFVVPRVPRGGNNASKKMPVCFPIEPFMRFMGWFLAEGSLDQQPGQYIIRIAQSREVHPENFAEIVRTIQDLGLTPSPVGDCIRCSSKDLWTYLSPLGLSESKYIPQELKQLAAPLLEILLDALVKGDGCRNGRGRDYASVSYYLARDVQEIALKCGYRSTQYVEERDTQQVVNGRTVSCLPYIYRTGIHPPADIYYPRPVRVPYAGPVRCVTVADHHTLLVRRNGRVIWAGNCRPINEATFCYFDNRHPSGLWEVYKPPVFHVESFDIIPAGASRDFNAILRCCKDACQHDTVYAGS